MFGMRLAVAGARRCASRLLAKYSETISDGGCRALGHDIGDRQLELPIHRRPPARAAPGRARREQQDAGGLADGHFAGHQERRRERRRRRIIEQRHHLAHAVLLARHVDVPGLRFFQRQPDEFSTALDRGPVIQLIDHRCPPL
jgi:hypothetical protein